MPTTTMPSLNPTSLPAGRDTSPQGTRRSMTPRLRLVSGSLGAVELLSGKGRLHAEELMNAALRGTGFGRTALDYVAEPLRRLLGAMEEEADLSALGLWTLRWDVHQLLSNLLRLQAEEESRPAILDEAVVAPIFITGLPRSGTTFLHRLMAEDPARLIPRHWQTVYPYPDASASLWFLGDATRAGPHVASISFSASAAGSYVYLDPVPGSAEAGMAGALLVQGSSS